MADPLSIASGVAGLISLGLTLCNGLQTYFSAIKDRDKDVEIATRDLNLLRFNIKIIESSASKVGNYYGLAGDGVNMGVKNCESQLKTLEILIRELTSDEGVLGAQQKWRKQKMLIRYPFDQKKLAQLQDQLSKANHTLSTFIQTFNLEVNIGMHNSLQIMDKDMRTNDTAMIDLLSSISTKLNVIGPTVQRTEMEIATLPIRVRDQAMATNNSRPVLNEAVLNDLKTQPIFISDQHQYLKIIYSSGNASPFDVDQYGNNIAHICLKRYITCFSYVKGFQSSEKAIEAMSMLLSYFFEIGVPVTSSNFYGSTILNLAAERYTNLWMLPKLYELATARDPAFCSSEFAHRRTAFSSWASFVENEYHRFNVWCEYPEISEAVGFQPIFLAVMQKDLLKLEDLLKDSNSLESILPKDLYNRNILHVSCDWAAGLRLLLEYEAVYPLLNATSAFGLSPLDHALLYSKMYCNAPDQWALCYNCSCFATVKLLLEADCSVTVGWGRPQTLKGCSLRARTLFFEHLKNRRERLRRISLAHLPAAVLKKYGITIKSLPDATAMVLWDELQKRPGASDLASRAVGLTDSLRPQYDLYRSSPEGLFSHPHRIEVVELALSYGFQPEDECGVQPFMSRVILFGKGTLEDVFYAAWLLQRDLEIDFTIVPFQLSAVHSYGKFLGFWINNFYSRGGVFPATPHSEFSNLLSIICHSERQSNVPCPCKSGIFNRPLSYLMSGLESRVLYRDGLWFSIDPNIRDNVHLMAWLVDIIGDPTYCLDGMYVARCAIHILTMKSLGIRHLPGCDPPIWNVMDMAEDPEWQEECAEILDEDQLLLSRLHDLEEEFRKEFEQQNISIANFLQGYWLKRMEEVEGELDGAVSGGYKSDLREVGVVLDEGEDGGFNPDSDKLGMIDID
ncbi:Ff.00g054370.m01.CDS01 [Fusarium sp. VM40]|nr:Ff.00g054370.m01.CDS01 [Fusarium sp. VM40]